MRKGDRDRALKTELAECLDYRSVVIPLLAPRQPVESRPAA